MQKIMFSKSEIGSVFLNNRTQSIRLKRSIRFNNVQQRLTAIKVSSNTHHTLYLTNFDINEKDNAKIILDFLLFNNEVVMETKDVSMFLNNKTEAVRIPVSMAFPPKTKQVDIYEYFITHSDMGNKTLKEPDIALEMGTKLLKITVPFEE